MTISKIKIMAGTQNNTIGQTLVAFRIGRGGRFHNAGFKTFLGQDKDINEYTNDLFESFENTYDVVKRIGERENLKELVQQADFDGKAYTRLKNWGLDLGQKEYTTCGGHSVGLYVDNDGTGRINEDFEYNTTYVCKLEDCNEDECYVILRDSGSDLVPDSTYRAWADADVIEWCAEVCGIDNNLKIAEDVVTQLNTLYGENIFSISYGSDRRSSTIINDKYRYEGNDVDITIDENGINGTITGKTVEFENIQDLIQNIDRLFINE